MSPLEGLALALAGLVTGVINVLAGGGSLVVVPLLVLLGLPPTVASATSRPALVAQNLAAFMGFRRGGAYEDPDFRRRLLQLVLVCAPLALLGAWLAAELHFVAGGERLYRRLLGLVLLAVGLLVWWRRGRGLGREGGAGRPLSPHAVLPLGAALGAYIGFIQAGVGFALMALLSQASPWTLARINAAKVVIVGLANGLAFLVFLARLEISWAPALLLILGQTLGGLIGSRLTMRAGETWLARAYVLLLAAFAAFLLVGGD